MGIHCWCSQPNVLSTVPPFLPKVASLLVDLDLMVRLSPSDLPLLLVILVLVAIFFLNLQNSTLKYYLEHKDIETVNNTKELERRARNSILAI